MSKKKHIEDGVVYTPWALANELAGMLRDTCDGAGLKINALWDPCCGTGNLLLAARRYFPEVSRKDCIGRDIDTEAATAARSYGFSCYGGDLFDDSTPVAEGIACVINPPYVGRSNISRIIGKERFDWLKKTYKAERSGSCDLAGYVLRHVLQMNRPAVAAVVATNTIKQGGTRRVGLRWALANGYVITKAKIGVPWGKDAAVIVDLFVLVDSRRVDGVVGKFNSRLQGKPEREDPKSLTANAGLGYQGSNVLGMGFTLTSEEREELIARNKKNAERIFPYMGGKEVNTSPTQSFHRYVINFGDMSLEEAGRWPDLLDIVREKVKPERDRNNREQYRKYWWHFGEKRPALYAAIRPLPRCLVNSQVSKHLMFSFQPTERVFSDQLYVFPLPHHTHFAILQSRIHEPWVRLLSSTMGNDLRYAASDCFDTFPFPQPDPRTVIPALESVGEALYEARARYMVDNDVGLTITYNRLKDPTCTEPAIEALREQHLALDRAVLKAYGWDDLVSSVPLFATPQTTAEEKAREAFQDEVIDRLFVLNAERAKAEKNP